MRKFLKKITIYDWLVAIVSEIYAIIAVDRQFCSQKRTGVKLVEGAPQNHF